MRFWKITPVIAISLAAMLLITGALFTIYTERTNVRQQIDQVSMQAATLAATVPAALSFGDQNAAAEYLRAMQQNPNILGGAIYDQTGHYFSGFTLDPAWKPPDHFESAPSEILDDILLVSAPVSQGGVRLGTVMLRSVAEPAITRYARYVGLMLLFVMGALVLWVLGSATVALAGANRTLERRASELAAANTQLKTQIDQREKAEATLRQVQKMESIGQLTGGIAHDFNNLLTIVLGNLERLQRRLKDGGSTDDLRTAAESATQGAKRAAELTRSLLAFSRRQPLEPRAIDLNRMIGNVTNLLRRTLGEQIAVETSIGAGLWRVLADPNQLESAIINLAVNARDAMPDGGLLTIKAENSDIDHAYLEQNDDAELVPGQYVMLTVSDTGCGMSKTVIEQAFEPFFTTKGVAHGTGLGLSQVYGYVKQSGGHVKLDSEVGRGTIVRIFLPRSASQTEAAENAPASVPLRAPKAGLTILVVEDEDDVRAHTKNIVEELGYAAVAARNGPAALAILKMRDDIALLFTDVGLPDGLDGRQLADQAVKLRPNLKVLFTTGYARDAIVHDGKVDKGVHLVAKPFTYEDVAAAIRRALQSGDTPQCVLIVEDESLIRMNLAAELEELGLIPVEAGTAREAIEIIDAQEPGIFAAVIDLGLPDRPGELLAQDLRARNPAMRIVIASGRTEDNVRTRFASDANVAFVQKPYDMTTLERAIFGGA